MAALVRCLVEVWNCVHAVSPRARASEARAARQREKRPFAVASRCNFGEPMQLELWVRIFLPAIAPKGPLSGRAMAFCKLRDDGIVPLICPTCQNVFAGCSKHPCQRPPCYFAWGCFRYFSWKREPRRPLRLSFPLM